MPARVSGEFPCRKSRHWEGLLPHCVGGHARNLETTLSDASFLCDLMWRCGCAGFRVQRCTFNASLQKGHSPAVRDATTSHPQCRQQGPPELVGMRKELGAARIDRLHHTILLPDVGFYPNLLRSEGCSRLLQGLQGFDGQIHSQQHHLHAQTDFNHKYR